MSWLLWKRRHKEQVILANEKLVEKVVLTEKKVVQKITPKLKESPETSA